MMTNVSEQEADDIEEHARLRVPVIYEIVRREGETDMARPTVSLFWSGLAAGLSLSFSLLTEGILRLYLPDAPWRHLVVSAGYTVGFLMVVLSRQQLFTENTITIVLPLFASFNRANLVRTARVWAIVLGANVVGTAAAALFCAYAPALSAELRQSMIEVSREAMALGWWDMLFHAVSAGFLMAAMVWLIPSAEGAEFHVVALMTWLIAVGGFSHIVAGSVEGFLLVFGGGWNIGAMAWSFFVPTLIGNVIGGAALFALISYAQVMKEM